MRQSCQWEQARQYFDAGKVLYTISSPFPNPTPTHTTACPHASRSFSTRSTSIPEPNLRHTQPHVGHTPIYPTSPPLPSPHPTSRIKLVADTHYTALHKTFLPLPSHTPNIPPQLNRPPPSRVTCHVSRLMPRASHLTSHVSCHLPLLAHTHR